jgi:ATP-dependent Lhr-like helicase
MEELTEAHAEFTWLAPECTSLIMSGEQNRWWTFAGSRANAMLANALGNVTPAGFDNLCIRFDRAVDPEALQEAVATVRKHPPSTAPIADLDRAIDQLKFSACLPRRLAEYMLAVRLSDPEAVANVLAQPLCVVRAPVMQP